MHNWKEITASTWGQPIGKGGLAGVFLLTVLALGSLCWTPYSPDAVSGASLLAPSPAHLLGTNGIGQDVFSQVLAGCRVSLLTAFSVGFTATALGLLAGAVAGYFPNRTGGIVIMRTVDVLMTIPRFPLIILLAVFLRPRLVNVLAVLVFLAWPVIARTIRSQVLSLRERDHIRFARFSGGSFFYIFRRHLIRELFPLVIAKGVGTAAHAIVAEAGLGFLGLGDPTLKSWGMMIRSALDYPGLLWTSAWTWWLLPPAIMVSLAVLSFTMAGFGVDEALRVEEFS